MTFNLPGTGTQQSPSFGLLWQLPLLLLSLLFLKALHNRYLTGLNRYPGPALAPFTSLWRVVHSFLDRHAPPLVSLHARYGDVVRLGPRCLSFADPAAITSFNKMEKSAFYPVAAAAGGGHYLYSMFSTVDERWHDRLRKSLNWIFTPQAVASYETLLDQTEVLFLRQLGSRFASGEENGAFRTGAAFDLSQWFSFFTFDFIGDLTYNRRYGFLREGRDIDGIIKTTLQYITYGYFVRLPPPSTSHAQGRLTRP